MDMHTGPTLRPDFHLVRTFSLKLTLPFMLFATGSVLVYAFNLTPLLDANYVRISEYQIWRIVTAALGSATPYHLLLNILWLKLLSNLSERRRGSLPFVFDVFFKTCLINSFSIAIYTILYVCSVRFDSVFSPALNIQQSFPYSGYSALLISETLFIILTARLSLDDGAAREEMRNRRYLQILLLVLLVVYLPYSQSLSAIALTVLNKRGVFNCTERLKISQFNFNAEQRLKRYERFFYFYFLKSAEDRDFYENREIMKISKRDIETTAEDKTESYDHAEMDDEVKHDNAEEVEELEVNKSRYEEVDVNDYILERSKSKNPKDKEPDSFEI